MINAVIVMNVREELFNNRDLKYREFHKKLIPGVNENKIIGVRLPVLRKIGKSLKNSDFQWEYYEEVMLHGFYIGYAKLSFEERLNLLDEFVPRIDNWAVCDCVSSTLKFIENNKNEFLKYLKKYMYSNREYELRFVSVILMDYYLDDKYFDISLDYLKNIKSDFYYVNMAVAWALSNAFVKNREKVLSVLESGCLSREINNMTVSKIRDSFRVDDETKEYLKKLKR